MSTIETTLDELATKKLAAPLDDQRGMFLKEYSNEAIINAFRSEHDSDKPVEQVISVAETVFDLIDANEADIPPHLIKVFWHLHQSFKINRNLILSE